MILAAVLGVSNAESWLTAASQKVSQPKANFMDELMSLKKSKSIGRAGNYASTNSNSMIIDQIKSPKNNNELDNASSDEENDMDEQAKDDENNQAVSLARVVPSIKNSGVTMRTSNNLNLYSRPGPVENHDLL